MVYEEIWICAKKKKIIPPPKKKFSFADVIRFWLTFGIHVDISFLCASSIRWMCMELSSTILAIRFLVASVKSE